MTISHEGQERLGALTRIAAGAGGCQVIPGGAAVGYYGDDVVNMLHLCTAVATRITAQNLHVLDGALSGRSLGALPRAVLE